MGLVEKERARRWRGGASSADDVDDISRGVSTLLSGLRQALVKLSSALDGAGIWYHMVLVGGYAYPWAMASISLTLCQSGPAF